MKGKEKEETRIPDIVRFAGFFYCQKVKWENKMC